MFDESMMRAIKSCVVGLKTKEVVTEYVIDEETNKLKISKQKVSEKTIPPNVDVIKLLYQLKSNQDSGYESLTDEELEQEKQRLLTMLQEVENGSREDSGKTKM